MVFLLIEKYTKFLVVRGIISIANYEVTYLDENIELNPSVPQFYTTNLKGLNYLQSISIYCTPRITITIYNEEVPQIVELTAEDLTVHYTNNEKSMIIDAQKLINMCEKRQDFSYPK